MRIADQNVQNVLEVARQLEELTRRVVFLGGAATGLLIDDPGAPELRASLDVDVVVEVVSMAEYYSFGEALRSKGFHENPDGKICS